MSIVEEKKAMKWYIVRAQSNREKSVSEKITKEGEKGDLMGKIGRVVVPIEKTFHLKNGKKVIREKVLYPGYIFVETNAVGELKYYIKGCNGASGFLTNRGGDILPLAQSEVDRMLGRQEEEQEKDVEIKLVFIPGEEIKILDGPFSGFVGTVDDMMNDQKVKVIVSIFGRKTPVELNITQIEKN
jgi:transcriptional antiterminator NusG